MLGKVSSWCLSAVLCPLPTGLPGARMQASATAHTTQDPPVACDRETRNPSECPLYLSHAVLTPRSWSKIPLANQVVSPPSQIAKIGAENVASSIFNSNKQWQPVANVHV